jgi:hypothetical protein
LAACLFVVTRVLTISFPLCLQLDILRPLVLPLLTSPFVGATAAFDCCRELAACLPGELAASALPLACSLRLVMLTEKVSGHPGPTGMLAINFLLASCCCLTVWKAGSAGRISQQGWRPESGAGESACC